MSGYIGTRAAVASPGTERKKTFAITTTTTNLTGLSYTPGFVHVYHNGIRLVDGTDYTATNGTSITLINAAENGDEVVVVSYGTFSPADTYTKAESDDRYVNASGDTMTGNLTTSGNIIAVNADIGGNLTVDTDTLFVDATNNRVGVGISSPQAKLDVTGDVAGEHGVFAYNTNASGYSALRMGNSDRLTNGDHLVYGSSQLGLRSKTGAPITFEPAGTERMRIDTAGRVTMPYQPSFRALSPATGNYTTVSGGIIPFNATSHNIGGHFNTSTYRFTAPVAGTYLFCFSGFNNGSSGERISIVVNGSTRFAQGSRSGGVGDWDNTAIFYLSVNDYVDVRSTYGGGTIYLAPAHTEFAGFFLG